MLSDQKARAKQEQEEQEQEARKVQVVQMAWIEQTMRARQRAQAQQRAQVEKACQDIEREERRYMEMEAAKLKQEQDKYDQKLFNLQQTAFASTEDVDLLDIMRYLDPPEIQQEIMRPCFEFPGLPLWASILWEHPS